MLAWSGEARDVKGPAVTRTSSAKPNTPPLKNGSDLKETGYLIAVGSRTARFRRKHKNKMLIASFLVFLLLLLCLAIVMTVLYVKQKRHKPIRLCETKECLRSAANLALSMDKTVDPCKDFYKYTCGNWAEDHPRPDGYRSYDWFRDKQIKVYTALKDFLSRNAINMPKPVQQAKDMYKACMDVVTLDKLSLKPMFQVLKALDLPPYPTYINVTDDFNYHNYSFDWISTVIKVKTYLGMDVLIGFDIFTDPKNSSVYRLVMGSPERTSPFPSMHNEKKHYTGRKTKRQFSILKYDEFDETFKTNEKYKNVKQENDSVKKTTAQVYKLYYAELLKLFVIEGGNFTRSSVNEPKLDQKILTTANDYNSIYNHLYKLESDNDTDTDDDEAYLNMPQYTADEIQAHTDKTVKENNGTVEPVWKRYLEGVFNMSDTTLDFDNDKILVTQPDMKYLAVMATLVSKTPPVLIELYIWIYVVEVIVIHTTTELQLLHQRLADEIHSKSLGSSTLPRSLQCASVVNDMMGMAVSYAIVDPYFFSVTKPKVETMIHEMKNSLAHLVGKAKWMDDDTKLATYQKIKEMKTFIGFPEWFMEKGRLEQYYNGIKVAADKHLENMISVIQFKMKKALNKFRESNNFTWATDPTEVNAYHTFQENTITVPMVILQYPFFNLGLDSLNYGSLGTVLGHEITHGFDNYGRQFDKNGNYLPWWTNKTVQSFVNMTQCFVDQYNIFYLPQVRKHVDGKKTLGENIADSGGVREAFVALRHHLQKHGPEARLPGFEDMTPEQLFFLSYGNLWCGVFTKDSLQSDLEDEHSPRPFRSIGSLQNHEEFASAFHCKPGSPMSPTTRCIIF